MDNDDMEEFPQVLLSSKIIETLGAGRGDNYLTPIAHLKRLNFRKLSPPDNLSKGRDLGYEVRFYNPICQNRLVLNFRKEYLPVDLVRNPTSKPVDNWDSRWPIEEQESILEESFRGETDAGYEFSDDYWLFLFPDYSPVDTTVFLPKTGEADDAYTTSKKISTPKSSPTAVRTYVISPSLASINNVPKDYWRFLYPDFADTEDIPLIVFRLQPEVEKMMKYLKNDSNRTKTVEAALNAAVSKATAKSQKDERKAMTPRTLKSLMESMKLPSPRGNIRFNKTPDLEWPQKHLRIFKDEHGQAGPPIRQTIAKPTKKPPTKTAPKFPGKSFSKPSSKSPSKQSSKTPPSASGSSSFKEPTTKTKQKTKMVELEPTTKLAPEVPPKELSPGTLANRFKEMMEWVKNQTPIAPPPVEDHFTPLPAITVPEAPEELDEDALFESAAAVIAALNQTQYVTSTPSPFSPRPSVGQAQVSPRRLSFLDRSSPEGSSITSKVAFDETVHIIESDDEQDNIPSDDAAAQAVNVRSPALISGPVSGSDLSSADIEADILSLSQGSDISLLSVGSNVSFRSGGMRSFASSFSDDLNRVQTPDLFDLDLELSEEEEEPEIFPDTDIDPDALQQNLLNDAAHAVWNAVVVDNTKLFGEENYEGEARDVFNVSAAEDHVKTFMPE